MGYIPIIFILLTIISATLFFFSLRSVNQKGKNIFEDDYYRIHDECYGGYEPIDGDFDSDNPPQGGSGVERINVDYDVVE